MLARGGGLSVVNDMRRRRSASAWSKSKLASSSDELSSTEAHVTRGDGGAEFCRRKVSSECVIVYAKGSGLDC